MDFDLTERQAFFRDRVKVFIDGEVRPRVGDYKAQIDDGNRWQPIALIEDLKPKARAAGESEAGDCCVAASMAAQTLPRVAVPDPLASHAGLRHHSGP